MTNEKYEELVAKLEKANVDITRTALFEKGTKKKKDCSVLFSAEGISEQDFLAEFGRRIDARAREVAANYTGPQSFDNPYQWRIIANPAIQELPKIGDSDKKVFQRIRFSRDPINNTLVMLVNTTGQQYSIVPLTSSKTSDMAKLSTLLAHTDPIGSKCSNYYEELIKITKAPFALAVSKFNNKEIQGVSELIECIAQHYPCSMLSVAYLKVLVEPVSTTILDQDGHEKERTVLVPRCAIVAQGDSTLDYSPIRHLVEQAPLLAADPSFLISMPRPLTNDPSIPAFKYVNLATLAEEGPCDAWDELLVRYTDDEGKVLLAYIYSLYVADNHSRQILYIEDMLGYSAKTVLQNAIVASLGDDQVAILQKDSMSNQFGLAKVWNKHVVFVPDNKNPNLVRSEKMHMMSGNDNAEIEYKGANSFFARLNIKVIACGNTRLNIDTSATHERSRVIVLRPKVPDSILKKIAQCDKDGNIIKDQFGRPKLIGDPTFEQRLKDEYRHMLFKAKKCYEELCPTNGDIILPDSVIQNVEECNDDLLDTLDRFVEDRFDFVEDAYVRPTDLREEFKCSVTDKDITFKDFTEHLAKKYGIFKKYSKKANDVEGIRNPVYVGLKPKP